MDLARGCRDKNKMKKKDSRGVRIGMNSDTLLIIKLPDSRVLRIISRSLCLAMIIFTLPSIVSIIKGSSTASGVGFDSFGLELLPMIFQDLADEGFLKKGHKGLIVSSGICGLLEDLQFSNDNEIDLVIESDLGRQTSIPNETFDLVFTSGFQGTEFIDRVLKIGGFVVMRLSNNPSKQFHQQSNYKIVYLRRFDSTVVAMRKTGLVDSLTKRRLCGVTIEAKKAALRRLEGVWLEPPRRALAKSSKIKFLPDLLEDSLESYQRRIFITDEKYGAVEWFYEKYPTRNQHFEIYNLEIAGEGDVQGAVGISDWLKKNVKEEDYVVMKAEAQMVEEMIKEKTICLVDELFLECKNRWQDDGEEYNNNSKRAYWQCLALYGKLRDEGVAVHQWWD